MPLSRARLLGPAWARDGLTALPKSVTFNGATMPLSYYYGGDASSSGWNPRSGGSGGNAALQAGTAPTYGAASPLPRDKTVTFNGGGYYLADNAAFFDVTTEDIFWEMLFTAPDGAVVSGYLGKTDTDGTIGHAIAATGGGLFYQFVAGPVNLSVSGLVKDSWYYASAHVNRDENSTDGARIYINDNGTPTVGSANMSAGSGSITNAGKMQLGNYKATYPLTGNIAYFAFAIKADWYAASATGAADMLAVHSARYAALTRCTGGVL